MTVECGPPAVMTSRTPTSEAPQAVRLAAATGAAAAVLKARSPSCGCRQIYDGTFTRTRVDGEGVTAEALRRAGLEVVSEEDVAAGWTGDRYSAG